MIALGELFCLILLAANRAEHWKGCLVLYVSDNEITKHWLMNRRANNRLSRYGIRILQRLECLHRFQVISAGVHTKHNPTMDFTTRATKDVIKDDESAEAAAGGPLGRLGEPVRRAQQRSPAADPGRGT